MDSMKNQFNKIVASVYKLTLEEKQELNILLEHNIADSRREEIYLNYIKALKEEKERKLEFSSAIMILKNNGAPSFINRSLQNLPFNFINLNYQKTAFSKFL